MKDGTFTADRLLALYDRVAEAEDAIPRLRRFVLDLAVRGKLVEQDPSDEPAAELLKRIAKEKARLVKAGEIRKPKPFDPIDEPPFAVPANWAWSRMREVTADRGQMIPNTRFTYIDVSAINKEAGVIEAPTVLEPAEAPSRARKIVRKGDVIYSCVRPYLLNVAVVEDEIEPAPIASTAFAIINGLGLILPRYIWIVLRSPFMVAAVEETQRGQAYPAINDSDFAVLPFPLPPLAEQQRIVAKVDELMALCDRLEGARAGREAVRDRLTAATLTRLTAPETDAETFPTHARFALQTLPTLTTRPDQIKTLRQTILNLAVRGKLVKQDPSDEPAAATLRKIADQKRQLIRTKKLKGNIPITNSISYREAVDIPLGWSWASCDELFFVTKLAGFEYTKYFDLKDEGEVPVLRAQNVRPWVIAEHNLKYMPLATSIALERSAITKRSLLITFIGAGIGDVALIEPTRRWHLAPNVAKAELFEGCDDLFCLEYAVLFFNSPVGRDEVFKHVKTTAQPSLSMGTIRDMDVLVPPLAEQHRIVAKVDALMALCDQLEASLTTATTTRSRLLEALLHDALRGAPGDQAEAAA
ncbi:restriction endonuclease subunit S [Gemmobacter denitrificans]|uniref:Restriction endonuclease subunit S n=1 Tax=Gemmobacter denitrificans TaxID=3123040 RepID=A0ABU8BYR2_9RHOB